MKSLLGLFLSLSVATAGLAADVPLPRSTPEAEGISSAGLIALLDEFDAKAYGLHSIVVVRHGKIVAEGWWGPYASNEPHMLFSLSKSFTSTAIGLLQAEGKINIHDPILKYFPGSAPENPSANLKAMRIRDLLMMSTGQHAEDVDALNNRLITKPDAIKQFLALPIPHKPGTLFYYNSPATYTCSAIVTKVTGQTVRDYLVSRLFEPLGISTPNWDISVEGYNHGASGLFLRTEDIAKFGQLLLQRGEWNGRRLIPADWIDLATSRQASNGSDPDGEWDQGYGFQFWRCVPGFYRADGAYGQFCIVMPQYDTVVAINSGTNDMRGVMKSLWAKLLPELRPASLPADEAAQSKLKARLAGLTQPTATGAASNATSARVSGKTFRLADNTLKIESVAVKSDAGVTSFVIRVEGADYAITPTPGAWHKGEQYRFPGTGAADQAASTGAWTGPDSFTLKISRYTTPFSVTVKMDFAGNELKFSQQMDVGNGPREPVVIAGKAD